MRTLAPLFVLATALAADDRIDKAAQALGKAADADQPIIVVVSQGKATVIRLPQAAEKEFAKYGTANGYGDGLAAVVRSLLGAFRSSIAVQAGGALESEKTKVDQAAAVAQGAQEELRKKADALRAEIK